MEILNYKYKRHRTQVTADDISPLITEKYADLSAATIAKFQKINGSDPVLLLDWGGSNPAKAATLRVFCFDKVKDYLAEGSPESFILNWNNSFTVNTNDTKISLSLGGLGSSVYIAVSSLTSNTTLDMFISDDPVAA